MFKLTEEQRLASRLERERLAVGNRVVVVDKWNHNIIQTVTRVTRKRIFVGTDEYEKESGRIRGYPGSDMLRGIATAEELKANAQKIAVMAAEREAQNQEREKLWAKRKELESLVEPLEARVEASEYSGKWLIDNLSEDAVRLIATALRAHAVSAKS
jgi:hypothetical protein